MNTSAFLQLKCYWNDEVFGIILHFPLILISLMQTFLEKFCMKLATFLIQNTVYYQVKIFR